jgi:excisionase family DNA binding protein
LSKRLLSLQEASKYLGIHKGTLYRFARAKKVPGFKFGRIWRFKKEKLDEWIDKQIEAK